MKEKLKVVKDYSSKIQILTPESWSRKNAAQYFEVSEYLIREARQLKNENGTYYPNHFTNQEKLSE